MAVGIEPCFVFGFSNLLPKADSTSWRLGSGRDSDLLNQELLDLNSELHPLLGVKT